MREIRQRVGELASGCKLPCVGQVARNRPVERGTPASVVVIRLDEIDPDFERASGEIVHGEVLVRCLVRARIRVAGSPQISVDRGAAGGAKTDASAVETLIFLECLDVAVGSFGGSACALELLTLFHPLVGARASGERNGGTGDNH